MSIKKLAIAGLFLFYAIQPILAQPGQLAAKEGLQNFTIWQNRPPLETIQAVGHQVIRSTPFQYKLQLEKASALFDFIKPVDFGRSFGQREDAYAVALSELIAARDTTIYLEVSHNDALTVFLNGIEVYRKEGKRSFQAIPHERHIELTDRFKADLRKGKNTLYLRSETKGNRWLVYLQPQQSTIEFSPVQGLQLSIAGIPGVDRSIAELSNWLILGPFSNTNPPPVLPGNPFVIGKTYPGLDGPATWTIPRTEIWTNVLNPHPLWGTLYNYNYHTAGLAWAMGNLGKTTGNQAFKDYVFRYCDFMLEAREMVQYQYQQLHGFRSVQHHLINTPLLDFTAAPTLPFAWALSEYPDFAQRKAYLDRVEEIKTYLKKEQVRLPDGTFTRETPEKMTTWVDDMFMGIPFLLHAGMAATSPQEKTEYLNEAARQVLGFNKQVFDAKDHLYHHAAYSTHGSKIPYWSRANGWGIFATSLVLQQLPKNHPSFKTILEHFKNHCEQLVGLQDKKSGFWHQILNDQESYLETSGTAIFTMALARGLNEGWLKGKKFEDAAALGWQAITSQISPEGDVYNICIGTMSSEDPNYYKTRPLVKSDSHGLIGVFWAAMEMDRLAKKGKK
jgi:unsaturated rhamnogalacturonyl hydrolase